MTFESTCYTEEEVLSDVGGTITRTGMVVSGVGGSVTDKCVRTDATLNRSGISTDVDGVAQWSDSPSVMR